MSGMDVLIFLAGAGTGALWPMLWHRWGYCKPGRHS